nr:EAL domain-containing protein [uncultured Dethiosulfovibrio sp.]
MASILVVDDNVSVQQSLALCLEDWGYDVSTASSGKEALDSLEKALPDLILLDIMMPGISGLDVLEQVVPRFPDLPVIMISGDGDVSDVVKAIRLGTWDYLMKPIIDVSVLAHAVEQGLSRARLKRENHEYRLRLEKMVASQTEELRRVSDTLRSQRQIDDLTGLPNRLLFLDRLAMAVSSGDSKDSMVGLFLCDLDDFGYINGSFGHALGNEVLVNIGQRFASIERSGYSVARVGSDEFALLVTGIKDRSSVFAIAEEIGQLFSDPILAAEQRIDISMTCGVAIYPDDGRNGDDILTHAGVALQAAKIGGKGSFRLFSQSLSSEAQRYFQMGTYMREALDREEFEVYYQPTINSSDGLIGGMEALLRWRSSRLGRFIMPDEFIPVAEELGMIVPLGEWVLRKACCQSIIWIKSFGKLRLSVNLSGRQFRDPTLITKVANILKETEFPPDCLDLELTENILIKSEERSAEVMHRLVDMGMGISIDDFGTGYSSMSYLKRFPVRRLKIDRSFISGIADDQDDLAITEAIITLGHALSKELVAEGVETEEQRDLLKGMGCDVLQGFLYSPPVPSDRFEVLLIRNRDLI